MDSEVEGLRKDKLKAEAKGNLKDAASICNYLGQLFSRRGQHEDALSVHHEELQICSTLKDTLGIAVAHRRIGECYSELALYKKAITHVKKYLELSVSIGSTVEEQRAWATLGRTYYFIYLYRIETREKNNENDLALIDKSHDAFVKGLELADVIKDQISAKEYAEMRARLLMNLGLVYDQRGNLPGCAESIQQAIFLSKKYSLTEDLHRCQFSLASVYQKSGHLNFALRLIDEAIASARIMNDKIAHCESLLVKAQILVLLKDFDGAKTYLKKAYKTKSPIDEDREKAEKYLRIIVGLCNCQAELVNMNEDNNSGKKYHFEKIGDGLASMGNFETAIEYYHKTLDCARAINSQDIDVAPIYYSLGQTYADNKQYSEALVYLKKEYKCYKNSCEEQFKTLLRIAEIMELQAENNIKIENVYNKALAVSEKIGDLKLQYLCLDKLVQFQESHHMMQSLESIKKLEAIKSVCSDEEMFDAIEEESQDPFGDICIDDISSCTDSEGEENVSDDLSRKRPRRRKKEVKRNAVGETPLHRACISGNFKLVKRLIENGHAVNPRDYCGWLPLHEAANYGYHEIVEYLIDHGAWINDKGGKMCEGITPLHDAATCGNIEIMKLLIDKGASITSVSSEGETPLQCLQKWRRRTEKDLDSRDIEQCYEMENYLAKTIKNIGQCSRYKTDEIKMDKEFLNCNLEKNLKSKKNKYDENNPLEVNDYQTESITNSSDVIELINDSEDMYIYPNPHLSETEKTLDNVHDAKTEYFNAISGVRRSAQTNIPVPCTSTQNENQTSAFLEDEFIRDWLVDDIGESRQVKRKRTSSHDSNIKSYFTNKTNDKKRSIFNNSSESRVKSAISTHRQSNLNESETNYLSDMQTTVASSLSTEFHDPVILSDFQRQVSSRSSCNLPRVLPITESICLRVKIGDKVILVPVCNQTCTINWLAEETSDRYFKLTGLRPAVSLTTLDGALLTPTDLISSVLKDRDQVTAVVDSWNLPSLPTCYEQACQRINIRPCNYLKTKLEECEVTGKLYFENMTYKLQHIKSLSSAIQLHENLKHLNISGCPLGDEGAQVLISCLAKLPALLSLSFRCCCLTSASLKNLANCIVGGNQTSQLVKLDLAFNCFSGNCTTSLIIILGLPSLNILDLSACSLTDSVFENKQLCIALEKKENLQELCLAQNNLKNTVLQTLLQSIPKKSLRKLDISGMCSTPDHSAISRCYISLYSELLPYLQELVLSACFLTDNDIKTLVSSFDNCPSLQELDISANPYLSAEAISSLVSTAYDCNIPLSVLHISGSCFWKPEERDSFCNVLRLGTIRQLTFSGENEIVKLIVETWKSCWGSNGICKQLSNLFIELKIS